MRIAFLLDANLSPETAEFLRSFGYDAKSLIEEGSGNLDDASVVMIAQKEKRIIILLILILARCIILPQKRSLM